MLTGARDLPHTRPRAVLVLVLGKVEAQQRVLEACVQQCAALAAVVKPEHMHVHMHVDATLRTVRLQAQRRQVQSEE